MGSPKWALFLKTKQLLSSFKATQKFHSEVLPRLKKLKINGVDINPSVSMTYLGIVLDQKLSWTPHIQKKGLKSKKVLHMIKPAINYIYGLNPKQN